MDSVHWKSNLCRTTESLSMLSEAVALSIRQYTTIKLTETYFWVYTYLWLHWKYMKTNCYPNYLFFFYFYNYPSSKASILTQLGSNINWMLLLTTYTVKWIPPLPYCLNCQLWSPSQPLSLPPPHCRAEVGSNQRQDFFNYGTRGIAVPSSSSVTYNNVL